jgi:hypothetical protein
MLANSRQVLCNSQNTARDLTQGALQLSVPVTPPVGRPAWGRAAARQTDPARRVRREGFSGAARLRAGGGAVHSRKNYGFLAELWASLRQSWVRAARGW